MNYFSALVKCESKLSCLTRLLAEINFHYLLIIVHFIIIGLPLFIAAGLVYLLHQWALVKDKKGAKFDKERAAAALREAGVQEALESEILSQLQKKYAFMKKNPSPERIAAEQKKIVAKRFNEQVFAHTASNPDRGGTETAPPPASSLISYICCAIRPFSP